MPRQPNHRVPLAGPGHRLVSGLAAPAGVPRAHVGRAAARRLMRGVRRCAKSRSFLDYGTDCRFRWDRRKAAANARKHGVTFEEAATAFADPRSLMIPDPARSTNGERFPLLGVSARPRLLVAAHIEGMGTRSGSSAPAPRRGRNIVPTWTSHPSTKTPMRREDDFSKGVRGKYPKWLRPGSTVIILEPDLAEVFGDSKQVNQTLRALLKAVPARQRPARKRTA